MPATTWCVVYNTSESSQVIDDEGHAVDPHSWACARRSFVRDLIDREVLLVIDIDSITDESNYTARMAKEEVVQRNGAIDAEKKADEDTTAEASTTEAKASARRRSTSQ